MHLAHLLVEHCVEELLHFFERVGTLKQEALNHALHVPSQEKKVHCTLFRPATQISEHSPAHAKESKRKA